MSASDLIRRILARGRVQTAAARLATVRYQVACDVIDPRGEHAPGMASLASMLRRDMQGIAPAVCNAYGYRERDIIPAQRPEERDSWSRALARLSQPAYLARVAAIRRLVRGGR